MTITLDELPILRQLLAHVGKSKLPLHVPGHHQGRNLPGVFQQWLGTAAKLDLTELPRLDNLQDAQACIRDSQALAAKHYGSQACYYSVNGSTAGVMAAIAAVVRPHRRKFIVLNPCHVSVWRGAVLADAWPVFAAPRWLTADCTFAAPDERDLERALAAHPDVAAVYLTSPTYQGFIAPVRRLVALAHQHSLPVIIDEAHGAHLGLSPDFPEHSVAAGADIVIQSAHKTLPSLTQTAWVHVQGKLVDAASVRKHLLFLQSTSPSYLLLASLDVAQAWLRVEGAQAAAAFRQVMQDARLWPAEPQRDPLRAWLPTGDAAASSALAAAFADVGGYLEYADATGALAMFWFGMTAKEVARFQEVVGQWRAAWPHRPQQSEALYRLMNTFADGELPMPPREIESLAKRRVPLQIASGQRLGQALVPYPPGVPVVWPGQVLQPAWCEVLAAWLADGYAVQGVDEHGDVEVICE